MLGHNPPDLPSYRVSYEYAFSNVGIDCAGPLFIKDIYNVASGMHKAYGRVSMVASNCSKMTLLTL